MSNAMLIRSMVLAIFAAAPCLAQQDEKGGETGARPQIGSAAPEFELPGIDGKSYKLSDYKDKIVVLEWVNKECPFCVKALPKMKELQKAYAEKGVVWLAIDSTHFHSPGDNVQWAKDDAIVYPILMDTDGKVGRLYGARTTPHMFIINKGKLAYMGAHDDRKDRNYVSESLDALLAGKDVPLAETKSYGCSVKYK